MFSTKTTNLTMAMIATLLTSTTSVVNAQGKLYSLFDKRDSDNPNCAAIEALGKNSANRDHEAQATLHDTVLDDKVTTEFELEITFKHDPTLPIPGPGDCQPGVFADDGLQYLEGRQNWLRMDKKIRRITGVDHISVDFNPCGHGPFGVFTVPHYDLHLYRVTPQFRQCMTCEMNPGKPSCVFPSADGGQTPVNSNDPADPTITIPQDTPNGRAFFTPAIALGGQLANCPKDFILYSGTAIVNMGTHAWNPEDEPSFAQPPASNWDTPIWIHLPYGGDIVAYETMFNLDFITGETDNYWEQELEYVGQTIMNLPYKYEFAYDAETGVATTKFFGTNKEY